MKKLFVVLAILLLPAAAFAQSETAEQNQEVFAKVVDIIEQRLEPAEEAYQIFVVEASFGEFAGENFTIDTRQGYIAGLRHVVDIGQKVQIMVIETEGEEESIAFMTDVVRLNPLLILAILFIFVVLAVGMMRGLRSLIGLIATFAILFGFILPNLVSGHNPLLITVVGSAFILAFSIFGTHGFGKAPQAAFIGTIAGLLITGFLAKFFTDFAMLTGLASEEAALLQLKTGMAIDMKGLLLAGIILGAVGVLDDVAVNQSETVFELKDVNPKFRASHLVKRSMRIGRHHIASVINTLVLAYAGAAMPLLILFISADQSTILLINSDFLAEEIIRTLVGTVGLVLTVPLATWFAALYAEKQSKTKEGRVRGHDRPE